MSDARPALMTVFGEALEQSDPAARAAYLDRACGANAELRRRVEALLVAHEAAGHFMEPAVVSSTIESNAGIAGPEPTGMHTPSPNLDPTPISITAEYRGTPAPDVLIAGRYTLQEKIGEGGMGEVWVAKQSEPVKRKVALKLIKPGMDSRAVLQRFEQERQALALMDHTNIAKVLDAGMTPNGQPFFVMELVNGLPLNKFCDELKLTPKERLELFVPICQAVQHAHQKGIVHRDLKPANILITMIDARPVPKVIDFGVAKATAGKLTDESMSTQFGAVVGTLEYMSPEQAGFSGEDIDTRAEIYSLGVILYELLTGLRPIDAVRLRKAALTEMIRIIREEEPSKPSTRLSTDEALPSLAALRQIDPRKLMTMLRGDLDWVVMKCLEKHRERRYETANALARDVQRYLNGDAVEACPPSVSYRMGKFLKRNKGPVVAASFVLLALVAGLIGTAWGMFRADRALLAEEAQRRIAVEEKTKAETREELAIAAVKKFRDAVANNPELKNNPALESLRRSLLKEPLAFFKELRDRLQADRDTRPESLARLAQASFDLGKLTEEIGDKQDALIASREALAIRQMLAEANPTVTQFQSDLALSHNLLGMMLAETGKPGEALKAYEAALIIRRKLVDANPTAIEFRNALARSHNNIGTSLHRTNKPAEALKAYESAVAIWQSLAEANPDVTLFRSDLATSQNSMGDLLRETGKPAEALKAIESAVAMWQTLVDANPNVTLFRRGLARGHHSNGVLLTEIGKPAEAFRAYSKSMAILQSLVDANPTVTEFRSALALGHHNIGELLSGSGKPAEALKAYETAVAILQSLADANPTATECRSTLASSHNSISDLLRETGKPAEALKASQSALAIWQALADANPTVARFQWGLALGHNSFGASLHRTGKPGEALKAYESALAILERLTREHPESPAYANLLGALHNNIAVIHRQAGRFDAAREQFRQAVTWQKKALTVNPRHSDYRDHLAGSMNGLIQTARELGDASGVAEAESELVKLRESDPALMALDTRLSVILKGDQQPKNNVERLQLAQRAYEKAYHATAIRLWTEAFTADPKVGNDRQAQHRYNAACAAALAASGQGKDAPKADEVARAKLRAQAFDWLKAELAAWKRISTIVEPGNKELVAKTMAHWKQDTDLATIRDEPNLAKLPEAERKAWQMLWADVEALLVKTKGK